MAKLLPDSLNNTYIIRLRYLVAIDDGKVYYCRDMYRSQVVLLFHFFHVTFILMQKKINVVWKASFQAAI